MENMWSKKWKYLNASTGCEVFTRKEMRFCTVDGLIRRLNCIINAYVLSALSLEGSRSSERHLLMFQVMDVDQSVVS